MGAEEQLTSIHLVARLRCVCPIRITDKGEAFCTTSFPVFGQKDSRNVPVARKHIPQILLFSELAHVCHTQRRAIIAIKLATHLLSRASSTSQMRRNIASGAGAEPSAGSAGRIVGHVCGGNVALGGHGVFEGTFGGEMVALADTALDLCVLQLCLLLGVIALVLGARFPVRHGPEGNILSDRHRVRLRARRLALLLPELGPRFTLSHPRVHRCLDQRLLDAPCRLVPPPVIADAVAYDGLGSIFVLGHSLLWEGDVEVVIFFGPVGTAISRVSC